MKQGLTRERVIDAAAAMVERDGVEGLSMRRLASTLGVAPTAIYWHVGNREQLLGALVDRIVADAEATPVRGRSPEARMLAVARSLRSQLLAHPHLVGVVHEHGRTALMFLPAQRALAHELTSAGLPPARAALALRSIVYGVVGFVLLEVNLSRAPEQHPTTEDLWRAIDDPAIATGTVARLSASADVDQVFEFSMKALVAAALRPS